MRALSGWLLRARRCGRVAVESVRSETEGRRMTDQDARPNAALVGTFSLGSDLLVRNACSYRKFSYGTWRLYFDSSLTLNEPHLVLSQRTPSVPNVEATHIPVTGEGKFGSVTGRQSSSPLRYDSIDHGAPRCVMGTNTHRSCASVSRSLDSTSSRSGSQRNSSIHCGRALPAESTPPPTPSINI